MVIDHVGYFLFPEFILLRMIGRIAFPCFVYGVVQGVEYTSNPYRYAGRMALMGLFSIVAWGRLFPINIGFTLALLVLGLTALRKQEYTKVVLIGVISVFVEFSFYGYLLGLILYAWQQSLVKKEVGLGLMVLLHILLIVMPLGVDWKIQGFALLFIPIYFILGKIKATAPKIPQWFGYGFYPVHVWVLRVMALWMGVSG